MKKLKNNIGMTLAEMLIVVAIIGVLGGVAFVAVWNYQRSMGQLERDGIAKEIFVAAQNHLTAAYGEGYLGLKEPASGSSETNPFGTKAAVPVIEDTISCEDGSAPDENGCCAGETYTDMGEAGFNCCPDAGGDCFPPIIVE
jgi:prepilin-type N-terminal cleavage/methylation domain-containing protein